MSYDPYEFVYESLRYRYMRPSTTSVCVLRLVKEYCQELKELQEYVDEALRYQCVRSGATIVPLVNLPPKTTSQLLGPLFNNKKMYFF